MSYAGWGPLKQRKHDFLSAQTMLYILKVKQCFLISSNHLSNFRVIFRHLLSNTRVNLKNGVAYKKHIFLIIRFLSFLLLE